MPTMTIPFTHDTLFNKDTQFHSVLDALFAEGYDLKGTIPAGTTHPGALILYKPDTPPPPTPGIYVPTFAEMLAALVDDKCQCIKHADGKAHVAKEPDPHNEDLDGFVCTGENMHPKTSCDIFSVIAWMQIYDDEPANWHMVDA